ncbi:hypothetical protein T440DRAFT_537947 [Plenodomus tracheiphilus IPT5]|uniref:Uncharacterized protein n=1 Tax=Plenodomus tracheiphilus IPT5 TaxID=1408161 RepID=A0A6A7AX60_9PLEO|nr:hypothetical protein T440DRAFT_537947 [Plenodomus tracheiphilus IPT5]
MAKERQIKPVKYDLCRSSSEIELSRPAQRLTEHPKIPDSVIKPIRSQSNRRPVRTTSKLDRDTLELPSSKRLQFANEHMAHVVQTPSPLTQGGDIVHDFLDTVTKVILAIGQKLKETEQALRETKDRLCRLDKERAAENQLQKIKDTRIGQLEQEIREEKAKCLIMED